MQKKRVSGKKAVLLGPVLRKLSAEYIGDKSAPSITMAFIPKDGQFYVSICRYDDYYGRGKRVMHALRGSDLRATVEGVLRLYEGGWAQPDTF